MGLDFDKFCTMTTLIIVFWGQYVHEFKCDLTVLILKTFIMCIYICIYRYIRTFIQK